MIAHLRGKLLYKHPGQAIVEAGGVGYDVTISVPTFTALPSVGAEAALHIHTQVSADQIALFGFLDREEKTLFRSDTTSPSQFQRSRRCPVWALRRRCTYTPRSAPTRLRSSAFSTAKKSGSSDLIRRHHLSSNVHGAAQCGR